MVGGGSRRVLALDLGLLRRPRQRPPTAVLDHGARLARPGSQAPGSTGPRTCCDTQTATVRLWSGSARTANGSTCRGPSWPPRWPRCAYAARLGVRPADRGRLPPNIPRPWSRRWRRPAWGPSVVLRAGPRTKGVVDRLQQIAPTVLIAVVGSGRGKDVDRGAVLGGLGQQLPSVRTRSWSGTSP